MPALPSASRGKSTAYAHLTILSDSLSPQELEKAVGLLPDESWAKGDPMRGGRHGRKFNGVTFLSSLDREQSDPGDHVEELAQRLCPHADRIGRLAADDRVHSARFWLYCQTTGGNPGFELSHAALDCLGQLGVTLALDLYFIDDEDS